MKRITVAIFLTALAIALGGCSSSWPGARVADAEAFGPSFPDAEAYLERGRTEFQARRYGNALAAFRAALAKNGNSVRALNGLGATYDKLSRHDLAVRYYAKALGNAPQDAETLNNLGYSFLMQRHFDKAERYFLEAARNAPPAQSAWLARIRNNLAASRVAREARVAVRRSGPVDEPQAPAAQVDGRLIRESRNIYLIRTAGSHPSDHRRAAIGTANDLPFEKPAPRRPAGDTPGRAPGKSTAGPIIEISNGAGRRGMAARLQAHLGKKGIAAVRLTNAASFRHTTSTIFYREGYRQNAEKLAALLPATCRLVSVEQQVAHVRVRLGGDLLEFDRTLITAKKEIKI